jgi:hypothetical protein
MIRIVLMEPHHITLPVYATVVVVALVRHGSVGEGFVEGHLLRSSLTHGQRGSITNVLKYMH